MSTTSGVFWEGPSHEQSQDARWIAETKVRSARLNKGLRGLWDSLRGRAAKMKTQNEMEAWDASKRDQVQRDIESLRRKHTQDRKVLAREIKQTMNANEHSQAELERNRDQARSFSFDWVNEPSRR